MSDKTVEFALAWASEIGLLKPQLRDPPPPKRSPIFVLGAAVRCGTHYLAELLSLAPECGVFPINEDYFLHHSEKLVAYAKALSSIPWSGVDRELLEGQILRSLGSGLLRLVVTQTPGKIPVLKTPSALGALNAPRLFPGSKSILLVRDPRDAIESAKNTFDIPFDVLIDLWKAGATTIERFRSDQNIADHAILVRYEDLFSQTKNEMKRILDFCGLNSKQYPFDRLEDVPVIGSSQYGTRVGNWVVRPRNSDFAPLHRWLNWSPEALEKVETELGPLMEGFGYPLATQTRRDL